VEVDMKNQHAASPTAPEVVDRPSTGATQNVIAPQQVAEHAADPFDPLSQLGRAGDLREARWKSEASFFDRFAEQALADGVKPFSAAVLRRYLRRRLRRRFSKEFRLQLLGDLCGKRVLDVGCGDGANAALLALRGAEVVGIDVSPRSIELAQLRAQATGVSSRARFYCSPIEEAPLEDGAFDVIWGDGILHHVIPELDSVLARLRRTAKSGARVVFSEPLCLWTWLRRLRQHVPVHTDATPDERPLQRAELTVIQRHFPDVDLTFFDALGRLTRFVLPSNDYEGAPWTRRLAADLLFAIDVPLLSIRPIAPLGGMAVLSATIH
jgi:2-polyprenyl-3-methyl-5-hydroxy-6-metoxy-1,4-benzoquinol methylase